MEIQCRELDDSLTEDVRNITVAWEDPSTINTNGSQDLAEDCGKRELDKCLQILQSDRIELSAEINNLANAGDINSIEIILGLKGDLNCNCCERHLKVVNRIKDEVFQFQENSGTKHALSLALLTGCVNGNTLLIEALVKGGADPNGHDRNGFTPLLEAYDHNNIDIVEKLLLLGAMRPNGITDAHLYCLLGREVATLRADSLTQPSADVRDFKGRLPVHIAARAGHTDLVKRCLQLSNRLLNAKDHCGRASIHYGARGGHMAVVELLLANGYNISSHQRKDKEGRSPLHYAAKEGHAPVISQLLAAGEKIDVHSRSKSTPLHLAARMRQVEAVITLLKHGANPNSLDGSKCTPMFEACATSIDGSVDHAYSVVEQIILFGGDPTIGKCNPLAVAGHERLLKLLLAHGASVNTPSNPHDGILPIHNACYNHNDRKLSILIEADSPFNAPTSSGATPLHLACLVNFFKGVVLLLIHQAEPNCRTNQGLSPLHYAAKHASHSPETMKTLLSRHAELNPVDNKGQTPFDIIVTKAISTLDISQKLDFIVSQGCIMSSIEIHLTTLFSKRDFISGESEGKWRELVKYLLIQICGHVTKLDKTVQSVITEKCDVEMADLFKSLGFRLNMVHSECPKAPIRLKDSCRIAIRQSLSQTEPLPPHHKGQGPINKVRVLVKKHSKSKIFTPIRAVRTQDVSSLPVSKEIHDFLLFETRPSCSLETRITGL